MHSQPSINKFCKYIIQNRKNLEWNDDVFRSKENTCLVQSLFPHSGKRGKALLSRYFYQKYIANWYPHFNWNIDITSNNIYHIVRWWYIRGKVEGRAHFRATCSRLHPSLSSLPFSLLRPKVHQVLTISMNGVPRCHLFLSLTLLVCMDAGMDSLREALRPANSSGHYPARKFPGSSRSFDKEDRSFLSRLCLSHGEWERRDRTELRGGLVLYRFLSPYTCFCVWVSVFVVHVTCVSTRCSIAMCAGGWLSRLRLQPHRPRARERAR